MSQSAASTVAPLFLRLSLGITFLWAGLGKFLAPMQVQGESAAVLANYGVAIAPAPGVAPVIVPPVPAAPSSDAAPKEDPKPEGPKGDAKPLSEEETIFTMPVAMRLVPQAAPTVRIYTAADFPDPVEVARLHGITLLLDSAAHPKPAADGKSSSPIWPAFASGGRWPYYLAYAVAITEVVCGGLVLIGFMTRLSALALAGTMIGAMWLTEFGPAWQAGTAYLGFLPPHPRFDTQAWNTFFLQFALLGSALALLFTGAGMLSIDRLMFRRPKPIASIQKVAP